MLPDGPIVVFDGVCNFCSGAVKFILRNDRTGRILFVALQSTLGQKLLREYGVDPKDADTILLIKEKKAFVRSEAFLEIIGDLGYWKWLRVFRVIPRSWRDSVYAVLAGKRYDWFGKRDSCFLPSEQESTRFIGSEAT